MTLTNNDAVPQNLNTFQFFDIRIVFTVNNFGLWGLLDDDRLGLTPSIQLPIGTTMTVPLNMEAAQFQGTEIVWVAYRPAAGER